MAAAVFEAGSKMGAAGGGERSGSRGSHVRHGIISSSRSRSSNARGACSGKESGPASSQPAEKLEPVALLLWLDFGVSLSGNATYTNLMARFISTLFMVVSGSSPSCRPSTDAATTDSEKCVCSYTGTYTQVAISAARHHNRSPRYRTHLTTLGLLQLSDMVPTP